MKTVFIMMKTSLLMTNLHDEDSPNEDNLNYYSHDEDSLHHDYSLLIKSIRFSNLISDKCMCLF